MRLWFPGAVIGIGLSLSVGVSVPVWAQFSDAQVGAFVEALRQAAPKTGNPNDGLYSEWQVQGQNIPRWSKDCLGRELPAAQFEANPAMARQVITCVMQDVLQDEYRASGNNPVLAVRRAASWWMTGDPKRYDSGDTATYTQKVLTFYQQALSRKPIAATPDSPDKPTPGAQTASRSSSTPYDRYMRAGYDATRRKDNQTALLYFKRALDERPEDTYATQAIRNIEGYLKPAQPTSLASPPRPASPTSPAQPASPASPASPAQPAQPANPASLTNPISPAPQSAPLPTTPSASATSITQQQAVDLINRWLQSKGEIFAPPFNQYRVNELTTGELLLSLVKPDGVIQWLKDNRAYYRYGVQKVDSIGRFVSSGDRATLEVNITEDRTLYLNGAIDPRRTDFSAQQIRYSLEFVDGKWKISDYKTVDGFLLERSILNTTTSSGSQ